MSNEKLLNFHMEQFISSRLKQISRSVMKKWKDFFFSIIKATKDQHVGEALLFRILTILRCNYKTNRYNV